MLSYLFHQKNKNFSGPKTTNYFILGVNLEINVTARKNNIKECNKKSDLVVQN